MPTPTPNESAPSRGKAQGAVYFASTTKLTSRKDSQDGLYDEAPVRIKH